MGVLPRGWDAFQMKAEQPATTMDMFTMVCLTEISQTLDMPLFLLTGDARLANMSSAYVATQSFMNKVRTRRSTRESQLDRIFAEFIDEARMIDGYLPGDLSPTEELDHAWRWDKVTRHADPEKGASASSIKIKTGASCPSIEVAEEGGDYEELENRAAKDYGVTVEEYRAALFQSTFTARGTVPPATLAPHTGYVDPGDTSKVDPDSEQ